MTATYTTISDTTLAQDKPFTQSVARSLRDNPIAITEGASGAPRVVAGAQSATYFQARRTTTQSNTGAGTFTVQANTEEFDPDSVYDNTTYQFKPTKAGIYLITGGAIGAAPATTAMSVNVRKNGAIVASQSITVATSETYCGSVSILVFLNGTTDYVDMAVGQGSSTSSWTITSAWFNGVALNQA